MTPPLRANPASTTRDALNRAVEKEWIDAADVRLVEILRAMVRGSGADEEALSLVAAALCRACAEGSLCLTFEKTALGGALRELLSAGTPDGDPAAGTPEALAARFLADADAGRLDAVLGSPEAPRPLLRAGGNLYFHRHWFAEKTVAEALRARLREDGEDEGDKMAAALPDILRETLSENPLYPRGPENPPLALAPRQKWAMVAALRERAFVLSGGPGTGKTTWIASWLRALLRMPGADPARVRLCAPTGRAAQRLQESLRAGLEVVARGKDAGPDAAARDLPVTTLHTLLGYQPRTGRFARGPEDPLDADWVLVDEASMVDVFLLAALARALPSAARLILVGDADQLPPVDAGSVLGELLPGNRLPCLPPAVRETIASLFPGEAAAIAGGETGNIASVMLDVSHRATGAVVPLAAAVRDGDADAVIAALGPALEPEDLFARPPGTLPVARLDGSGGDPARALRAWANAAFAGRKLFHRTCGEWLQAFRTVAREDEPRTADILWEFLSAARVLAPLKRGPVSTERANRLLRDHLEPLWSLRGDAPGRGFHGSPILITRNDRATGLSNGEIGLWLEAAGGAAVFFRRPELPQGWLRLPVSQLPAHEPGFAVTVHKSQGSEYDAILLLLPGADNRLLARETLYTAITRARGAVHVFGAEDSIREAVKRKLRRQGGMRKWLERDPTGKTGSPP